MRWAARARSAALVLGAALSVLPALASTAVDVKPVTVARGLAQPWALAFLPDGRMLVTERPGRLRVVTPDGRLSRYFYGIEYAPRDLKFALIESSAGRVGSIVDQVLLYCYHYDPKSGSYSFVAMKAIRLGGAFTLLALAGFVVVALRRDERVRH